MTIKKLLTEIYSELRLIRKNMEESEDTSMSDTEDRFLTVAQASSYLKISSQCLAYRTRKGFLSKVSVGGKKGYMLSDLKQIKSL